MNCWKCHKLVSDSPIKLGFRATCPHCERDLHVCMGCRYYAPGKPNDCAVPLTEPIRDREAMNFCEEFAPQIERPTPSKTTKPFNTLFKDE